MKELKVCYGEGDKWEPAPESHGTVACMAAFSVAEGFYLAGSFRQQQRPPKKTDYLCSWRTRMYPGHPSEARLYCPVAGICLWVSVPHQFNIKADFHLYASPEALLGDARDLGLLASDRAVGLVCSLATPQ